MRVGYIFNHEHFLGGGEVSLLDLLLEVRRHGVVPVAFVPANGEIADRLNSSGVRCVVCPWPHLNVWSILPIFGRISNLAKLFADEKLDLVHVNGARSMLYCGPAAKKAGIRCVWHVRVIERDGVLDRIRAHYATAIIANSKAVSTSLAAVLGNTRSIDVIYNGFDLAAADKAVPFDIKKEFGLADRPVVLCMGRFTREKAFEDAISACGILQKRGLEVSLLLVGISASGDAEYQHELENLVRDTGVRSVVFSTWRSDVHSVMKAASVFVLCSRDESFGRVIVEAWSAGLPVVATRCGGPDEIVEDNVDGLLVGVGDVNALTGAVERLIKFPDIARGLSEKGLEKCRQFSTDRCASDVISLYKRVLPAMSKPRAGNAEIL